MIPFAARGVSPALTRLVRLFGLPEEAVNFVAQASWDDPLRGMSGCHERPVIVELAAPSVVSPQAIWAGASRTWTYHGDVFLFPGRATVAGHRCTSPPAATAAVRMVAEARSEVTFSEDPGWGPLRGIRGRWPTFIQSDSAFFPPPDWGPTWDPLLTIDGRPWFLRHRIGPGRTFFWAGPEIPDIAAPITPEDEERGDCLLPLPPLIFFLRRAFGDMLWHTPRHYANLIVDDPPIRDRYGYFAPAQHLGALRGCPHATTIAFIPWNWRRSTASAIELFRQHESELSLCVHGCD